MKKQCKQKILAVLLASVMTISIAGMSTAYAENTIEATESTNATEIIGNTESTYEKFETDVPIQPTSPTKETIEASKNSAEATTEEVKDLVEAIELKTDGTGISSSIDYDTNYIYYKLIVGNTGTLTVDLTNKTSNTTLSGTLFNKDFSIEYESISNNTDDDPATISKTYYLYSGTYYFKIKRSIPKDIIVDYTVKANFNDVHSNVITPNNDYKSAMEIAFDTKYSTVLEENAVEIGDWYRITLDKTTKIKLDINYNLGANFDVSIWECENEDTFIPKSEEKSRTQIGEGTFTGVGGPTSASIDFTLEKGTYYIVFGNQIFNLWHTSSPCQYDFCLTEKTEISTDITEPHTTPTIHTSVTNPTPTTPTISTSVTSSTPTIPTGKTTTTTTGGNAGVTGKVATGDTNSIVSMLGLLFLSVSATIVLRKKVINK